MAEEKVVNSGILKEKTDIRKLKKIADNDRGSTLELEIPRIIRNTGKKSMGSIAKNSRKKKLTKTKDVLADGKTNFSKGKEKEHMAQP
jgi:hypothetical protein